MPEAEPIILTIDYGTQSVRAIAFNSRGDLVAKAQTLLNDYTHPEPGWMEHDVDGFWQIMADTCQKLWAESSVRPEQVQGLVVTTQRATVINLDSAGKPLRPAIIWTDQRQAKTGAKLPLHWRLLFKLLRIEDTVLAFEREAEINWIAQNQPEIWRDTAHFLLLSGYLNYRLTGEFIDGTGSQVGYIPFDFKSKRWCKPGDWKWHAMQITLDKLPKLVESGEKIGEVTAAAASATGLLAGTPVFAGASDKACEVLGAGCLTPNTASVSCGTTATINTTYENYLETRPFIPPYPAAMPGHFNCEVQVFRGYWMVSWFKKEFGHPERQKAELNHESEESYLDDLGRDIAPGSDGLVLQPLWNPGLGDVGPEARGSIIGFNDGHTRAHLYRALLEGLAYALREGKERIEKRSKIPIERLQVSGGGSQSDVVMQILADVMNLPADRPSTFEASGLGAAIIGAVSLGYYSDFHAAAKAMTGVTKTFSPHPQNVESYDKLFRNVYTKQYERLKPLYIALEQLRNN